MSKITPDHLVRSAHVYIRQSTLDQVHRNHESRRRQYGLVERARQLGWGDVVVIDDDLAISGDGVKRPGFEASRNSCEYWLSLDWATLIWMISSGVKSLSCSGSKCQ